MKETIQVGLYYQAIVPPERCWFFTAVIRSQEHLCFDRSADKTKSIVEFFVPAGNQKEFESLIATLAAKGLVHSLILLPNRFADSNRPLNLMN